MPRSFPLDIFRQPSWDICNYAEVRNRLPQEKYLYNWRTGRLILPYPDDETQVRSVLIPFEDIVVYALSLVLSGRADADVPIDPKYYYEHHPAAVCAAKRIALSEAHALFTQTPNQWTDNIAPKPRKEVTSWLPIV